MRAPVLDHAFGHHIGLHVVRGQLDPARLFHLRLLVRVKARPPAVLGKIGGSGDGDKTRQAFRPRARQQQGLPAAHAGPYGHDRPGG